MKYKINDVLYYISGIDVKLVTIKHIRNNGDKNYIVIADEYNNYSNIEKDVLDEYFFDSYEKASCSIIKEYNKAKIFDHIEKDLSIDKINTLNNKYPEILI